jgi:hypothetical protein
MDKDLNLSIKKIELIQWLSSLEDERVIEKLMEVRTSEANDWWENIANEEKKAVEKGLNDSRTGAINPHTRAREIYEKWL